MEEQPTEEDRKEQAQFYRDKHVLETCPKVDDKITAITLLGVAPENFDKLTKKEEEKIIEHSMRQIEMKIVNENTKLKSLELLREIYKRMIVAHDQYFDDSEANRTITNIWTIGTWMFSEFNSYPRLYFNAMRGSGKTRKLKYIESLAFNGKLQSNLSEAVLFRTAKNSTILIDEAEGISSKEKGALRELLNAGYKKGNRVLRMKKVKIEGREEQVAEAFDLYSPVALANISGLEDVLSDRSISLVLEKSNNPLKINLIEDFDTNPFIQDLKRTFQLIQCNLCSLCSLCSRNSVVSVNTIQTHWNIYTLTTLNTYNTYNTLTTHPPLTVDTSLKKQFPFNDILDEWELKMFEKIKNANINGRPLELYFPLFIISQLIGDEVLDELIHIARLKVCDKKKDDTIENKDVALYDFISRKNETLEYFSITELTHNFKEFYFDDEDHTWMNTRWFGRALKRLNLIRDKVRHSKGWRVQLHISRAKEKMKMFKIEEEDTK
jgi:hypothetical protein